MAPTDRGPTPRRTDPLDRGPTVRSVDVAGNGPLPGARTLDVGTTAREVDPAMMNVPVTREATREQLRGRSASRTA